MQWATLPTSSSVTAQRLAVAKKDYLKEAIEGFEKWLKLCACAWVLWIILDILPHLPESIGERVANKLLGLVGL